MARFVAIAGFCAIVVGFLTATYAARRRPPNWRRMTWREVARVPGTREGVMVTGLILLVAGGIALGLARLLH